MKAYALDLREQVVKFIRLGGSKAEAARRFELGRSTVYRYLEHFNKSCSRKRQTNRAHLGR